MLRRRAARYAKDPAAMSTKTWMAHNHGPKANAANKVVKQAIPRAIPTSRRRRAAPCSPRGANGEETWTAVEDWPRARCAAPSVPSPWEKELTRSLSCAELWNRSLKYQPKYPAQQTAKATMMIDSDMWCCAPRRSCVERTRLSVGRFPELSYGYTTIEMQKQRFAL